MPTDTGVEPPQPWGTGIGVGATAGGAAYVDSLFRFCARDCGDDRRQGTAVVVGADYGGE